MFVPSSPSCISSSSSNARSMIELVAPRSVGKRETVPPGVVRDRITSKTSAVLVSSVSMSSSPPKCPSA